MDMKREPIRLNLGCGRNPIPGYVNIDNREGPGVDRTMDLDRPNSLSEFATGSVEVAKAHGLLEHPWHWENLVEEVGRVLLPGGIFDVRVPFKTSQDYTPYHVRRFDKHSFDQYRADAVSLDYDLVRRRHTSASLEFSHPYFTLDRLTTEHWFPFAWHLATQPRSAKGRIACRSGRGGFCVSCSEGIRNPGRVDSRDSRPGSPTYSRSTNRSAGCSRYFARACTKAAPTWPSMARWSNVHERYIISRITTTSFRTTGRFSIL